MAVAATTFAACNKEDITPVVEQGNKSVTLNIANVFQTKGTGTEVENGSAVKLNTVQVFFSDGTDLHTPKTVDAKNVADTYFGKGEVVATQFHFLPKAVTKVIVLGNMPEQTATTEAALLAAVQDLTVGEEQDPEALSLFGIDTDLTPGDADEDIHDEKDETALPHPNPYVQAEVNLVPTVARFEVTGFEYAQVAVAAGQTAPARNYTEMVVNSLSMRKWYTTATANFAGEVSVEGASLDPFAGTGLNKDNIYATYFTKVPTTEWYYDATAYTLKAANNYVQTVATVTGEAAVSDKKCFDYHVFPGAVPQFLIELTGKEENGLIAPLFLMTSALKVNNAALTAIEAGKVYRMAMRFDDNNLQAPEKCVEVAITVDDWNVLVVTPEF